MSIASEITRLQNDSAAIAAAIAAKGVTVPAGSGYDDYATLIGQISGGGGGSSQVGVTTAPGSQGVTQTFTGLQGQPKAFAIQFGNTTASDGTALTLNANRCVVSILCDGTHIYSACAYRSGSTAREYLYSNFTFSYSGGTLTVTSPGTSTGGAFLSGTYKLLYIY